MGYWIYVQRDSNSWNEDRNLNTLDEAKEYVEKRIRQWKSQGFKVPKYKIMYGKNLVQTFEQDPA